MKAIHKKEINPDSILKLVKELNAIAIDTPGRIYITININAITNGNNNAINIGNTDGSLYMNIY